MLVYRLQVTQFAAGNDNISEHCTILQDDTFEVPSDNKHGLQRKALERVLNEDYREMFATPKWTNEDVRVGESIENSELYMAETGKDADGYPVGRMMHMTAYSMPNEVFTHLVLYQVNETATVTFQSTVRNMNVDKDWFIAEIVTIDGNETQAVVEETIQATNIRAAKLRLNGTVEGYGESSWADMPFNGGIYKNHDSDGTILVLRAASETEAAELGNG